MRASTAKRMTVAVLAALGLAAGLAACGGGNSSNGVPAAPATTAQVQTTVPIPPSSGSD